MAVEIDIDHVARLARLALTDKEKTQLAQPARPDPEHAAKVSEVAAEDVPPTAYAIPRANVYREDIPEPSIPQGRRSRTRRNGRTDGSRSLIVEADR